MHTDIFIDCEMTSLLHPQLLSVGLVTMDGHEFYAEVSLDSELGRARLAETSHDVRDGVVDGKWGLFPDATFNTEGELAIRLADWLLEKASTASDGVIWLVYDYELDRELIVEVLQTCEAWERLRGIMHIVNIAAVVRATAPALAAEATYRQLRQRTPALLRHHALADALALRTAARMHEFTVSHRVALNQLIGLAGEARRHWLFGWLATPTVALGGRTPMDFLCGGGDRDIVADILEEAAK